MTVEELQDEISAIDAIFPGSVGNIAPQIYNFAIPPHEQLKIQLNFPSTYPETKPELLQVISEDSRKYPDVSYFERHVEKVLERIFQPDEVCVFELIAELEEFLEEYDKEHELEESLKNLKLKKEKEQLDLQIAAKAREETTINVKSIDKSEPKVVIDALAGWIQSDPLLDRGSTFIAFVRQVDSVEEAEKYVSLLITDRKISRATHNISSWRIKGENGVQYQDCDDDGETAAGGRLLHLLTMMEVWNVVVVVSRWFGGTHLGPDRFKHINSVAREGVIRAGFIDESNNTGKKKKK